MKNKLKITERGWAGHFCAASNCNFRRNTLIEYGNKRIVVSTVGNYIFQRKAETIGCERYYETMAFKAYYCSPYWEADVTNQLSFESNWNIDHINFKTDQEANEMHENVVKELFKKIKK